MSSNVASLRRLAMSWTHFATASPLRPGRVLPRMMATFSIAGAPSPASSKRFGRARDDGLWSVVPSIGSQGYLDIKLYGHEPGRAADPIRNRLASTQGRPHVELPPGDLHPACAGSQARPGLHLGDARVVATRAARRRDDARRRRLKLG